MGGLWGIKSFEYHELNESCMYRKLNAVGGENKGGGGVIESFKYHKTNESCTVGDIQMSS